jgi:hypothetical protein
VSMLQRLLTRASCDRAMWSKLLLQLAKGVFLLPGIGVFFQR